MKFPTIEIGCGDVCDLRFDVRADIQDTPAVTHVFDMCSIPFDNDTFCLLKAAACIEHITPEQQQQAVSEFRRVLIPHGVVYVQTPDAAYWTMRLGDNDPAVREWAWVQMKGGERDEFDMHKGLLNAAQLVDLFESNGFRKVWLHDGNEAAGSLDACFEKVEK